MYGLTAYKTVDLESAVKSASPHKLITMLMDEALKQMRLAKIFIEEKKPIEKGKAIGKAISIIQEGLLASLDLDNEDEIIQSMGGLYEYVTQQLIVASARKDQAIIDVCLEVMGDIREGWVEAGAIYETQLAQQKASGE